MPKEFKLPDLGEGIHEGEVVEVLVAVGDRVEDGTPIMIVETDKAETEIPSPINGIVQEIRVKAGDVVNVGDVLMVFALDDEAAVEAAAGATHQPTERRAAAQVPQAEKREAAAQQGPALAAQRLDEQQTPVPAAPSTRRLARELGVDLREVPPSGPGGRVTPEDVRAFAEQGQQPKAPPAATEPPGKGPAEPAVPQPSTPPRAPSPAAPTPALAEVGPLPDFAQWGPVERQPLRSVRRATARRMAQSWAQIPHVTHSDEADITELEAFRQKHKQEVAAGGGTLSLTVFALKAAVAALKAFPRFNASLDVDHEEIILKSYYHIGVAMDTDKGLMVPSIREVDRKSIFELARELDQLIARAREGKVGREDMSGGTFTITNIGPLGGTGFTPIINYPQVAILGLAKARQRPVVLGEGRDLRISPRLMLPLILGFDHRVLDGADAARFLNLVIATLQDPEQLLMKM